MSMAFDLMKLPVTRESELDRKIEVRIGRIMVGRGSKKDRQELQDLSIRRTALMERAGLKGFDDLKRMAVTRSRVGRTVKAK